MSHGRQRRRHRSPGSHAAAVAGFDDAAARQLAETVTRIPSGTDFGWRMHLTMPGVGKVPEAQGRRAAQAALKIIDGVASSQIPIAHNEAGELDCSPRIAARRGVEEFPSGWIPAS